MLISCLEGVRAASEYPWASREKSPRVPSEPSGRILFLAVMGSDRMSVKIFYTIFASVFATNFLGHDIPECLQKPSGRVPGASPGPPRTVPERLRADLPNNFERIAPKVLTIFCEIDTFGMILRPGRSPKIDKNPTFLRKVSAEERLFTEFCGERCFSRFFDQFWLDFWWKIDVFLIDISQHLLRFFQPGDPHDSMVFTYRKLCFHFSRFCVFSKKLVKHRCKTAVQKNHRKLTLRGPVLGPKIDENRCRSDKNCQNC